MAKYIIDVPEKEIVYLNVWEYEDGKCVWTDSYTNSDLRPYTASESYIDGLKKGQNDAWEFVMKCLKMDGNDFYEIFGSCDALCLTNLSYQEAKTKCDEWKKEKEQIRVGDEVIDKDVGKAIVTNIYFEVCSVLWFDGSVSEDVPLRELHKTGRHFNETEELLKKMREEG